MVVTLNRYKTRARNAQYLDFIARLPEGWETLLGELGRYQSMWLAQQRVKAWHVA